MRSKIKFCSQYGAERGGSMPQEGAATRAKFANAADRLREGVCGRGAMTAMEFEYLAVRELGFELEVAQKVYTACIDGGYVPTPELSWPHGHCSSLQILAGFSNKVIMSSAGGQRPPANRMTLQTFKARLGGASKGFKLLKKKRDALKA
eukprot:s6940_g1.t1